MSDNDALHALLRLQKKLIGRGSGASCCTDVKIVKIREEFKTIKDALANLVAERDEARAQAERWGDDALRLLNERNAAQRERDEARREVCWLTDKDEKPTDYARLKGWDCFGPIRP